MHMRYEKDEKDKTSHVTCLIMLIEHNHENIKYEPTQIQAYDRFIKLRDTVTNKLLSYWSGRIYKEIVNNDIQDSIINMYDSHIEDITPQQMDNINSGVGW